MGRGRFRWAAAILAAVITLAAGVKRARAEEPAVALLMDAPGRAEIGRELLVALAERHARVVAGDAPVGDTPLVRAAVAQRMARGLGATLALWIEPGTRGSEVRAVLVDGQALSRAPLPGVVESLEPRVVATVGASLVDELWGVVAVASPLEAEAPAPAPEQLTVEIRVDPEVKAAVTAAPAPRRPAATAEVTAVAAAEDEAASWSLGVGDALQASGAGSLELRVLRRAATGWYMGGWTTIGDVLGGGSNPTFGLGLDLGGMSGGDTYFTYGAFTGVGLAPETPAVLEGLSANGYLGALLLGARVGLVLGLTRHFDVRIDFSAAAEATALRGNGLVSWLSLLVEVRQ